MLLKISDEGTKEPFYARLFFGILELRDIAVMMGRIDPNNRQIRQEDFDAHFKPLLEAMRATRDATKEIMQMVESHNKEIVTGEIVQFQEAVFTVNKSIDSSLHQAVGQLLDQGTLATKDMIQALLKDVFEIDIGFLYQQEPTFNTGLLAMREVGHYALADYLQRVRSEWSDEFIKLRNSRHSGWIPEGVKYRLVRPGLVRSIMPEIQGMSVEIFARKSANRILLLIENLVAYSVQDRMRVPLVLVEIPKEYRNPSMGRRFQAVAAEPGVLPWKITYRDDLEFV